MRTTTKRSRSAPHDDGRQPAALPGRRGVPMTAGNSRGRRPLRGTLAAVLAGLALLLVQPVRAFDAEAGAAPHVGTGQGSIEALFSPWDDIQGAIVDALREARRTIHVQAFVFTSRTLAKALIEAHARGVRVEVLADGEQVWRMDNSRIPNLAAAGIPVALEFRYASAHNKIMLIDAEGKAPVVLTGSYNFTWSAQAKNAENLLILRGDRPLMRRYFENWRRHRAEAEPYAGASSGLPRSAPGRE
jgi:phosphatidylserine/phosphatidylglycerophosphate/cardiolipin synthase-like enzyme